MKRTISDSKISRFEVIDHGIDGCQYFSGCGTAYTDFTYCATGCGDTFAEALDDARDQLASGGWIETKGQRKALDRMGEDSDDTVSASAEVRRQAESDSSESFRVEFTAYCGMTSIDDTFDSLEDARREVSRILRKRRKTGHPVSPQQSGSAYRCADDLREDGSAQWEILEPEGCAMVPDTAGILTLSVEGRSADELMEEYSENSELYYYVSIRVR